MATDVGFSIHEKEFTKFIGLIEKELSIAPFRVVPVDYMDSVRCSKF